MIRPQLHAAIDRLLQRQGLGPAAEIVPLEGGRLNQVLRINGQWVLRCREGARSTGSLRKEASLRPRIQGRVPAPEIVSAGMDDLLGEYLLQGWIPGTNLLRAWMGVPDTSTREWWVAQLAEALRSLHEVRCDAPGEFRDGRLDAAPSWRVYVESRVRKRLDALMRVPRVDRELILAAERYLRRRAGVLDDRPCSLIHRDCHFSNVVVDGPHLAAILDFELAEAGPPDYELDTLFRMVRYPALYGPPEFAGQLTPARFASVWLRLRRGYPELFAGGRLRERLCLYALDHDLSCLLQAATHPRGTAAEFEAALARLREILSDRYGPD